MSFVDKSIKCSDCGYTFAFTTSEQELFSQRGYANDPKRCPFCRAARKAQSTAFSGCSASSQQMFPVVCTQCGKVTKVPFEPRGGRPVYCRDCYISIRPNCVLV